MFRSKDHLAVRLLIAIVGAILAAIGLELFLIPHAIIVGGATGISAILAYFTDMRIGFLLFLINLPFILLSYRRLSKQFVSITVLSLFIFALTSVILYPYPSLVEDAAAAAIVGGLALGGGIGLVVRFGGSLDGSENTVRSASPAMLSTGPRIKLLNVIILLGAGFIFGWIQALYSAFAYWIAVEIVGLFLRGFSLKRTILIKSNHAEEICKTLELTMNIQLSFVSSRHVDLPNSKALLSATIHLFEISRMKAIVISLDPEASFHIRSV